MDSEEETRESIVVVPGLGGSVLETESNASNWTQIWPSVKAALPFERSYWKNTIQTLISDDGRRIRNSEGASHIRPRNFGGVKGISTLYEINWRIFDMHLVNYFRKTIEHLQSRGITEIYGAPYDFRLVPDPIALKQYFQKLKALIEECTSPVTLIAHSLGAVMVTVFLYRQTPEWKSKYIKRYISVSGPYGGATKAIHACLTGDSETPIAISPEFYRQLEIRFGGVLWMINNPEVFGDLDIVNEMNANQLGVALSRKGSLQSAMAYENLIRPLHKEMLKFPGVETHLVYGTGTATMIKLNYAKSDFSDKPEIEKSDGDGTVPLWSLQAVKKWPTKGEYPIFKAHHLYILNHPKFLNALDKIFGF